MRRLLLIGALLALSVVSGLATGFSLYYRVAYLFGLLLSVGVVWALVHLHGIEVHAQRRPTGRAQVGDTLESHLVVRNRSLLPKLWVEIRDLANLPGHRLGVVLGLRPRSETRWVVQTPIIKRGLYTLGPVRVRTTDLFEVFGVERTLGSSEELLVYPATVALPGFRIPKAHLSGQDGTQRRALHVTPHAAAVRAYAPGDSLSRVHWASTARTGHLMVKEFDRGLGSEVWVALDMEAEVQAGGEVESTEEYGVTIAASVAHELLRSGWPVGLLAHGEQRYVLETQHGMAQLERVLDALARMRAYGRTPLNRFLMEVHPHLGSQSSLVVVTPALALGWTQAVQALIEQRVRVVVVLVEPASFGKDGNSIPVRDRLQRLGVPTYVVRRGDSLDQALSGIDVR